MLTDHEKTSNELKSMVQSGSAGVSIPSDLDSSHQKTLDKLKGLNGAEFTKQYDKEQVSAHKEAVSLFRRYAKSGDDAALKNWAGKTLPDLERHLELARNLEK